MTTHTRASIRAARAANRAAAQPLLTVQETRALAVRIETGEASREELRRLVTECRRLQELAMSGWGSRTVA